MKKWLAFPLILIPGGLLAFAVWFFFFRKSPATGKPPAANFPAFAGIGGGSSGGQTNSSTSAHNSTLANIAAAPGIINSALQAVSGLAKLLPQDLFSSVSLPSFFSGGASSRTLSSFDNATANSALSYQSAFNDFGELATPGDVSPVGSISYENSFSGGLNDSSLSLDSNLWNDSSDASLWNDSPSFFNDSPSFENTSGIDFGGGNIGSADGGFNFGDLGGGIMGLSWAFVF